MAVPAWRIEMGVDKLAMLDSLLEHVPREKRPQLRRQILRETNNLEDVSVTALRALSRSLKEHMDAYLYLGNHDD